MTDETHDPGQLQQLQQENAELLRLLERFHLYLHGDYFYIHSSLAVDVTTALHKARRGRARP